MNKLFVGNLSFKASEESLVEWIEAKGHGVAQVQIMVDRDTGKSRGFGFVTLTDANGTERAIRDLNGADFLGRQLTVNEAKPREPRGGGNGGRGRDNPRW